MQILLEEGVTVFESIQAAFELTLLCAAKFSNNNKNVYHSISSEKIKTYPTLPGLWINQILNIYILYISVQ